MDKDILYKKFMDLEKEDLASFLVGMCSEIEDKELNKLFVKQT